MIQHDDNGVSVVLPQGRMTNVVITAIELPGHFFVRTQSPKITNHDAQSNSQCKLKLQTTFIS